MQSMAEWQFLPVKYPLFLSYCNFEPSVNFISQQKHRFRKKYERKIIPMKFTDKDHNYIESDDERESGHEDTRYKNFECVNKSQLGCNLGIDVAG